MLVKNLALTAGTEIPRLKDKVVCMDVFVESERKSSFATFNLREELQQRVAICGIQTY